MQFWSRVDPPAGAVPGVQLMFTSRRGGVSRPPYDGLNLGGSGDDQAAVEANRAAVAALVGLPRPSLLFMRQVHGGDVVVADGPWPVDGPPQADAIVTTRGDLALAALAADCVPVLLADRHAGVVGAVHSGRPGLVRQVVVRAVERLRNLGARDIEAVVGPAVCGRCYEVPSAMRDEVAAVAPASACSSWTGTPALDIAAGVVEQLAGQDVRVTRVEACTREERDLYSYRRDGTTGRFAGVVRLLVPSDGGPAGDSAQAGLRVEPGNG